MLRNLATLARTCDWARRYDVIVFHEGGAAGDALRPRLEALRNGTGLRLRARDISAVFATHAPATTDWPRWRLRTFGIGYRRMCRFWFSGVFEVADVRILTYLLRLDTDSELRCRPGSRDPFELMARRRAVYGYVAVKTDHPMVAKNLTAFGAAYARRVPQIQDAFYRFPPRPPTNCPAPMFYTNFEVMDVSWFAAPRAVAFARFAAPLLAKEHEYLTRPERVVRVDVPRTSAAHKVTGDHADMARYWAFTDTPRPESFRIEEGTRRRTAMALRPTPLQATRESSESSDSSR